MPTDDAEKPKYQCLKSIYQNLQPHLPVACESIDMFMTILLWYAQSAIDDLSSASITSFLRFNPMLNFLFLTITWYHSI